MSQSNESVDVNVFAWNVRQGGFSDYQPSMEAPERGPAIQDTIAYYKQANNVGAVCLSDAYLWDEQYGGDAGIAQHLGYREARYQPLNDARLLEKHGKGIGVVCATDAPIEATRPLDLGTREGLSVILGVGTYGLQLATVYLDDLNEATREKQVKALLHELESDMPTIIAGDFNMLRADLTAASCRTKFGNFAVRVAATVLPNSSYYGEAIGEMNKRKAMPLLAEAGFADADAEHMRPTAPAKFFPAFGVDYMFSKGDVVLNDFQVVSPRGGSDHLPIIGSFQTR